MYTAALVGTDGSIDWYCIPHFDSPSVFAAILDDKKGGFFKIAPCQDYRRQQFYYPETNVLITRFLERGGVGELIDFMPVADGPPTPGGAPRQLIRRLSCVRGSIRFRLECRPAFDYARQAHILEIGAKGAVFRSGAKLGFLVSEHLNVAPHFFRCGRVHGDLGELLQLGQSVLGQPILH